MAVEFTNKDRELESKKDREELANLPNVQLSGYFSKILGVQKRKDTSGLHNKRVSYRCDISTWNQRCCSGWIPGSPRVLFYFFFLCVCACVVVGGGCNVRRQGHDLPGNLPL